MAASASSSSLRVVLIEDSPILCAMLRDMLNELDGVEVVADADGEQAAVAELERQQADVVIVDLELRQGSGLGVLACLQAEPERYGSPRAVVFSNYGHSALRARCKGLGVEYFFDKSFQMDELLEFIQSAAARH
ncbi:response regulator [Thauera butanivorans]|jgi:DNA-binding NarL/FixJ family response regulator|uniref:response regulator n=1 Tax=Thauera butanivorans TaxID=86174 RepID=UPI000837D701|nr:response regulator [Thauera butanivorans]